MFDILLGLCIAGSEICEDRLLPVAFPSAADCVREAPVRAEAWVARHEELELTQYRCVLHETLSAYVPPLTTEEVAPGVFVHRAPYAIPTPENGGDLANIGFVVGETAVAVIDAGGSRAIGEQLYTAIRERTDLPIGWLVLTHVHPDHILGASVFREAGARIVAHPGFTMSLGNRAGSYETAMRRLLGERVWMGTELIAADEGAPVTEIDLGGRVLELDYHDIAHSETDMTAFDRATGTWFVGDLVFAGHTPALDGSILGWQRLLAEMAERSAKRIVPGHGPASLDWPKGADPIRAYLAAITEEARAAIRAGEPLSAASRHIGESQRGSWALFDEFNRRNATAAFKELEWE
ncbi:MAG: quinoprotein relay system zinc metallohydrolase 2 [Pseudomonadota bacterium]